MHSSQIRKYYKCFLIMCKWLQYPPNFRWLVRPFVYTEGNLARRFCEELCYLAHFSGHDGVFLNFLSKSLNKT